MTERPADPDRGGGWIIRWFVSLHGGQVAMLWICWGLLWWATFWVGAAAMWRDAEVWATIALVIAFGGVSLLMVLTWMWFGARRLL